MAPGKRRLQRRISHTATGYGIVFSFHYHLVIWPWRPRSRDGCTGRPGGAPWQAPGANAAGEVDRLSPGAQALVLKGGAREDRGATPSSPREVEKLWTIYKYPIRPGRSETGNALQTIRFRSLRHHHRGSKKYAISTVFLSPGGTGHARSRSRSQNAH